jgi:hypothetical protein
LLRVGVLLDDTHCHALLADAIEAVAAHPGAELHLIVNRRPQAPSGRLARFAETLRKRGLARGTALILFSIVSSLELRLLGRFSSRAAEQLRGRDVGSTTPRPHIEVTPIFSKSGLFVRYGEEDLTRLRALGFDLFIRGNNSGILKGGILSAAKEGILSFHHGDNSWNRGGPPAFWEVYQRRPATGFIIQLLTEELDGGKVLFRGSMVTRKTYSQNLVHLYAESNHYLIQLLRYFLSTGALPPPQPSLPHGERLLVPPSVPQLISYVGRTLALLARDAIGARLGRADRWSVGFTPRPWREANLRKGVVIKNPPGRFLADPFVVERDGRTICFVEDYYYDCARAAITAIEIRADGSYEILGKVLDEPVHLSFPYLFEHQGDLYMIPESVAANNVRAWRCEEFPLRWTPAATLLEGVSAADTMVFEHDSRWWMLTNVSPTGAGEHCSQLHIFHSDHPLSSDWRPHRQNPVVYDPLTARSGGILEDEDGTRFRVRQKQAFGRYGAGFSIAQIVTLTETGFEERVVHEIGPRFLPGIAGSHHMHSNGRFTVYDFVRKERVGRRRAA